MSIADELRKLEELRRNGTLTEEEFTRAKAGVLSGTSAPREAVVPGPESFTVNPDKDLSPGRLRTMQIIAGALLVGVSSFFAVALFLVHGQHEGKGLGAQGKGNAPPPDFPIVTAVGVGWLAITAPLAFILPGTINRRLLPKVASGTWPPAGTVAPPPLGPLTTGMKLLGVYQSTMIVGLALLEGTAFFGCIAYLLEASPWALGIIGIAVALQLLKFPTYSRVRSWLEQQALALAELRRQRGLAAER